jgi:hypothetical protein
VGSGSPGNESGNDRTPPSPIVVYPRISDPAERSSYESIQVESDPDTVWVEIYIRKNGEWVLLPNTVEDSWTENWRADIDLSEWENDTIDIRVLAGDESGNVGEYILEGVPVIEDGDENTATAESSHDYLNELLYLPLVVISVLVVIVILLVFFILIIKRDYDRLETGEQKTSLKFRKITPAAPGPIDRSEEE